MKIDWYESQKTITIVIYTQDHLMVSYSDQKLEIILSDESKEITLFGLIVSYKIDVYPTKKEIVMIKEKEGLWGKLSTEEIVRNEHDDRDVDGNMSMKGFLENLYEKSNDKVKKAMLKSFLESGGKVLKTNDDDQ